MASGTGIRVQCLSLRGFPECWSSVNFPSSRLGEGCTIVAKRFLGFVDLWCAVFGGPDWAPIAG
jgi:hypothetical protein